MEFHSFKLSDSKFLVNYTSREKRYLEEVHANFNPKGPIKFFKVELCADYIMPN